MTEQDNKPARVEIPTVHVEAGKQLDTHQPSHPLVKKAMRDTGYLVWTNIGC